LPRKGRDSAGRRVHPMGLAHNPVSEEDFAPRNLVPRASARGLGTSAAAVLA
jgi:hypothetical protein